MVLVIDNYDSFTYNLVQYLGELGAEVRVMRNDLFSLEDVVRAKPAYEYEESRAKARGVVRAIELAAGQEAWP